MADSRQSGPAPAEVGTARPSASRLTVWPKRWLALVVVAVGLSAGRALGFSWMHAVAVVVVLLLLLEGLSRQLSAARMRAFERQLAMAIQEGDEAALLRLYRRQWLLHLIGPRHWMLGKLALVQQQRGNHLAAERALRDALGEAPPKEVPLLAHRLADALYAGQRFKEAERYYRRSQDEQRQIVNPGVQARIARLIRQRGGDLEEAEAFLRRAVEEAKGRAGCGLFRCQLIEVLAARGKQEDAVWQLQVAEEEMADADEQQRACLQQAREAAERLTAG